MDQRDLIAFRHVLEEVKREDEYRQGLKDFLSNVREISKAQKHRIATIDMIGTATARMAQQDIEEKEREIQEKTNQYNKQLRKEANKNEFKGNFDDTVTVQSKQALKHWLQDIYDNQ